MSQRLILPVPVLTVADTAVNPRLPGNIGIDCCCPDGFVRAAGEGMVAAAELYGRERPQLTIIYPKVLCNIGVICTLACRMWGFDRLLVQQGDQVKAGDLIGECGKACPSLHVEFDLDTRNPQLLGNPETAVSPLEVWFCAPGQQVLPPGGLPALPEQELDPLPDLSRAAGRIEAIRRLLETMPE